MGEKCSIAASIDRWKKRIAYFKQHPQRNSMRMASLSDCSQSYCVCRLMSTRIPLVFRMSLTKARACAAVCASMCSASKNGVFVGTLPVLFYYPLSVLYNKKNRVLPPACIHSALVQLPRICHPKKPLTLMHLQRMHRHFGQSNAAEFSLLLVENVLLPLPHFIVHGGKE